MIIFWIYSGCKSLSKSDEKFGNYSGKALVATADMRTEFLNAFYKNQNVCSQLLFL